MQNPLDGSFNWSMRYVCNEADDDDGVGSKE